MIGIVLMDAPQWALNPEVYPPSMSCVSRGTSASLSLPKKDLLSEGPSDKTEDSWTSKNGTAILKYRHNCV